MSLLRRRTMMASNGNALPNGYQKVNYLEGTGTQYIDTGFVPDVNSAAQGRLAAMIRSDNNCSGCVLSESRGWFMFGCASATDGLQALFCKDKRQGVLATYDSNYHDYYISNGLQKIDDQISNVEINAFGDVMLPVRLFSLRYNWGGTYQYAQKISEYKLWQNGVLAHNFVPCLRVQDNKPGMYDVVTEKFFTNDGTGEFLYG